MKKIKTYVITLSKNYMKGHPKAGQPTNFREKFLSGEKIHTIRGNYELWKKRLDEVRDTIDVHIVYPETEFRYLRDYTHWKPIH